jgi:hypothetical protein
MPYEISFTRPVTITDRERYFNECCVAGDQVSDRLLPAIRARYIDIQENQEDWGWFIWFRKGSVKLAVDIHTDDADAGQFRLLLSSRKRKLLFDTAVDTPELGELRNLVVAELEKWQATQITVSHEGA